MAQCAAQEVIKVNRAQLSRAESQVARRWRWALPSNKQLATDIDYLIT